MKCFLHKALKWQKRQFFHRSQMRALNDCHGTWCHSITLSLKKTLATIKILIVLYFEIVPV